MDQVYSLYNTKTNISLWTTSKSDEIIKYINGEDLSIYYVKVAEPITNLVKQYSGYEFMLKYKKEDVVY